MPATALPTWWSEHLGHDMASSGTKTSQPGTLEHAPG
jgi:hypothetical protein